MFQAEQQKNVHIIGKEPKTKKKILSHLKNASVTIVFGDKNRCMELYHNTVFFDCNKKTDREFIFFLGEKLVLLRLSLLKGSSKIVSPHRSRTEFVDNGMT